MRWLMNRYSYYVFSALAVGAASALGSRFGGPAGPALAVGVGAVLATAQAVLRSESTYRSWPAVQGAIHRGGPTLLFIYSDT